MNLSGFLSKDDFDYMEEFIKNSTNQKEDNQEELFCKLDYIKVHKKAYFKFSTVSRRMDIFHFMVGLLLLFVFLASSLTPSTFLSS